MSSLDSGLGHRKDAREKRGLSEYSIDYCFPGDEFGFELAVLVGRERCSGAVMAITVPLKASTGRFVTDKVLEWMDEVGDKGCDIVVKSGQLQVVTRL